MQKPTIYLDVDGVILANEAHAADYADEFIDHIVQNYPTVWLTTHCMHNDPETVLGRLEGLLKPHTMELLTQVRGAKWDLWKTEAIDFTKPFLWFDDDCYPEEQEALNQQGCLANWIEVDLYKNPQQLKDLLYNFPTPIALNI